MSLHPMPAKHFCDFCGKHQDEVAFMVAGPSVDICDECVAIAVEVVAKAKADADAEKPAEVNP